MTYVTTWQFVNADASHILRRNFRTSRQLSVRDSASAITARADPTVQTTDLPGNWQYSRCLAYVNFAFLDTRIRSGSAHASADPDYSEPGANHVFPYQITFPQNNSAQNCLTQCSTYGYPAAGMENGTECCVWLTAVELLQ